MGVCGCKKPIKKGSVSVEKMMKVSKAICKIVLIETKQDATGFFLDISPTFKCLLTNYHVISQKNVNTNIAIQIENDSGVCIELKLDKNERFIKCFDKPIDITVIQIKNTDGIMKYFNFLEYDKNFINENKNIQNKEVFTLQHRLGKNLRVSNGKITKIFGSEFAHNMDTDVGSSGSPIVLISNAKVIGIHKSGHIKKPENYGTFIEVIIRSINQELMNNSNRPENKNINNNEAQSTIVAILAVTEPNINKDILIINSHENSIRNQMFNFNNEDNIDHAQFNNEEEIKQCEIKIDGKRIDFTYTVRFPTTGRHFITYTFKNRLTKCNRLFYNCEHLISINLSKFNAENITDMSSMFHKCKFLFELNLANLNTKNLTNMGGMFAFCPYIKTLDLSYFDTSKVTDMRSVCLFCFQLETIKFSSKFNTRNVVDMNMMFGGCKSLKNIDLSNFNTQNVVNMFSMFSTCSSLTSLDLSSFNTLNAKNMSMMFDACHSLTYLNLLNFNSQNATDINKMFRGCNSLTRENIITSDENIIEEYNNKI